MSYKGLSGGLYKPLSENDVEVIHEASLEILEKTGFTYESGLDATLAMLENAGAFVDRKADRIYFPRDLILEQAAKAPAQVILYSRDGQNDLNLTEDRVHLGTGGAAIKILDLETGDPRPSAPSTICISWEGLSTIWKISIFFCDPASPPIFLNPTMMSTPIMPV